MTRRICSIVENNYVKNKSLRQLKENFRTYHYFEKNVEIRMQKALKIPQTRICQPKTIENKAISKKLSTKNGHFLKKEKKSFKTLFLWIPLCALQFFGNQKSKKVELNSY